MMWPASVEPRLVERVHCFELSADRWRDDPAGVRADLRGMHQRGWTRAWPSTMHLEPVREVRPGVLWMCAIWSSATPADLRRVAREDESDEARAAWSGQRCMW